jgi:hypothetical protein
LKVAQISLGAGYGQLHHQWETRHHTPSSLKNDHLMKDIIEFGRFLGHVKYTHRGDQKFRRPGTNTSFWEAALVGPVPGTAAYAILSAQQPDTKIVSGTVVGVNSAWFAKIRASNLFGNRLFEEPYDDFPFPCDLVSARMLIEEEHRLAYAQQELPKFELVEIKFGRNKPVSANVDTDAFIPTWG